MRRRKWWTRRDSNPQPLSCKESSLPIDVRVVEMGCPKGFEPLSARITTWGIGPLCDGHTDRPESGTEEVDPLVSREECAAGGYPAEPQLQ